MSARKSVEKRSLTRTTIMDAARDLFSDKGYQHVSMRQIARKLNYSHGAIYYHFENKAALFYALVEEHFLMLERRINDIDLQKITNMEKLRILLLGFIEFGLTHQSHYEIMFLIKDEEVRNFINQGPSKTYEKFAKHVALYSEQELSIRDIFSVFLSLHGFVTHYLRHVVSYAEVKSLAEMHVDLLMKWTHK